MYFVLFLYISLQSETTIKLNNMENMTNNTTKFEIGNVYAMSFITDSELKPSFICVGLTKTQATFERFGNPTDRITKKVKTFNGVDYIVNGSYSMAPVIKADKVVA